VDLSVINGKVIVEDGELTTLTLPPIIERHNRMAKEMVERASAR
jgi:8-oxoguanine deaminase